LTEKDTWVGQSEFKIAMELVKNWVIETLPSEEAHLLLASSKLELANRITAALLKMKQS
jgi:hypothetical protein